MKQDARTEWFYVTKKIGKMDRCGAFAVGILSIAQAPGRLIAEPAASNDNERACTLRRPVRTLS